jgi:hypothetical protein
MKNLVPVPRTFLGCLRQAEETGMGYQIVAVRLKDGRWFNQVTISEGHIVEVRGYRDIPFAPEDVDAMVVNHNRWNFRNWSDARK